MNGPTWIAGKSGNAVRLDGVDDYVQVSGLLGQPSQITLAAWASLESKDSSGSEVISLGDCLGIRLDNSDGKSGGFIYDGSYWSNTFSLSTYAGTNWHHFAYVFSPGSQKMYVDGTVVATTSYSDAISYAGFGQNTMIGKHGNGEAAYDFKGLIDDLRVYDRALSAAEISQLYSQAGQSFHPADTNQDCQVDMTELDAYISRWKLNNLDVTMSQMMGAVGKWKSGQGC
jgi:hypothetical protein